MTLGHGRPHSHLQARFGRVLDPLPRRSSGGPSPSPGLAGRLAPRLRVARILPIAAALAVAILDPEGARSGRPGAGPGAGRRRRGGLRPARTWARSRRGGPTPLCRTRRTPSSASWPGARWSRPASARLTRIPPPTGRG
ncbi:MAG: hypothetical protein MZV64_14635 [Ignavibacteriales bacterium]|nr:hypothetical protein [Ignavibacteriales bacterium]